MYVVAFTELAPLTDQVVGTLAAELGIIAYDARLLLGGGAPHILLTTPDLTRAQDLTTRLLAHGHRAVIVDDTQVVPSARMTAIRRFRFEASQIVLETEAAEALPYDDVHAVLRAYHQVSSEIRSEVKTTSINVSRVLVTGMVTVSTKTTQKVAHDEEREGVMYLFRRSEKPPWILRESHVSFLALGAAMLPTRPQNYARLHEVLRRYLRHARFDDSLLSVKRVAEKRIAAQAVAPGVNARTSSTSSEAGIDLRAHIVALGLTTQVGSTYRT